MTTASRFWPNCHFMTWNYAVKSSATFQYIMLRKLRKLRSSNFLNGNLMMIGLRIHWI